MEAKLPILIVGAGPVGLMAACELARRGVAFRIIDKAPEPSAHSKALAIFPRTLEVFDLAGMADAFISQGHPLRGISITSAQHPLVHLDLTRVPSPHAFVLSLPQCDTERILTARLEELGGKVERGVELVDLLMEVHGATATLRGPAGEETFAASWVIGCDGAHSTVRHLLHVTFAGNAYDESFILADVKVDSPLSDHEAHLFFNAHGLLAYFPFKNGRGRIVANLPAGEFDSRLPDPTLAEIQQIVTERGPGGIEVSDAVWTARFHISRRKVGAMRHARVFLAGDAAHIHSPAGGQGMNTGLQDAFNLAWKLALVWQGWAVESLLDSYHEERDPVATSVLNLTDQLTRMATLKNAATQALRDILLPFLTGFHFVEERIAERMAELTVDYRNSPIVENHHGLLLKAGDRAPDAILHEGARKNPIRLFDVFRHPSHTLLLFVGAPQSEADEALTQEVERDLSGDFGKWMRIQRIGPDGDLPTEHGELLDTGAAAHQAYHAHPGTIILVRPDGYIGFRGTLDHKEQLRSYLERVFIG